MSKDNNEFDDFAGSYQNLASQNTKFFETDYSYFARTRAKIISRCYRGNAAAILDFGCGVGLGIDALRESFPHSKIVGCDPSQESLNIARTRKPDIQFVLPEAIPPVPTFKIIVATSVFHHILPSHRDATLRYCSERLKLGGCIFIFEHNPYNPITRRLVSTCPFDKDAILLTKGEVDDRLLRSGFSILAGGYFLFFPTFLASLRPFEEKLGWLPLGGQYFVAGARTK